MPNFFASWGWNFVLAAAQQTTPPADGAPPGSGFQEMIPIFAMLAVVFYLIVLRPQKKEKQERQKMLDALKKGDLVTSIGGIHGKVFGIDANKNLVSVEVAPKIVMKFNRSAIQAVEIKKSSAPEKPDEKDEKELK